MDWYVAPLYSRAEDYSDVDNPITGHEGPGTGDPVIEFTPRSCKCYAHDATGSTVLVSVPSGTSVPADWVKKTVPEARTHFQTIRGRSSNAPGLKE